MDSYDYVMHGKVFKFKDSSSGGGGGGGSGALQRADVYASFGGLLMQLTGEPKRLEDLDIDQNIYLLIRKVT